MTEAERFHPSLEQLTAFDRGQLPGSESAEIERHVAACDDCCRKLQSVPDDELVALLRVSAAAAADTQDEQADPNQAATPPGVRAPPKVPEELVDHPRYRILGFLGAGGMGAVFKAEHRLMERVVVLKVIHRSLTDRPTAVERFRLEVKAAARLSHANIVTAHDADQADDVHFLVMEFVAGASLDRVLAERGPLPIGLACEYARQAALGLQHAFEQGMVHRDIKPANLMLTPEGRIKILDFGLARFASETGTAGRGTAPPAPTEPGAIVGTPDYMAPEQALEPRQADIRADIYSLGCTLYHLLSGRPPFPEGTPLQKLMAHQERRPRPVSQVAPGVAAALAAVLERMMARDPGQRYQTPAEVAQALAPFARSDSSVQTQVFSAALGQGEPGSTARPAPGPQSAPASASRRIRRVTGTIALLVAMAVLLGVGAWALDRYRRSRDTAGGASDSAALPAETSAGFQPVVGGPTGPFTSVAFSIGGRQALAAGPDFAVQLWDLQTGEERAHLPGHTGPVHCLAFSRDGRRALSGGEDKTVRLWDLSERVLLATFGEHTRPVRGVAFAWDGRHAFSTGDDGRLILWETNERRSQQQLRGDGYGVQSLSVDRFGGLAAVGCSDKQIRLWDLSEWRPAWSYGGHQGQVTGLAWSSDVRFLLSGSLDSTVRLWRGTNSRQLCRFDGHTAGVQCVALSNDARWGLSGSADRTVRLWDLARKKEAACYQGHEDTVLTVAFPAGPGSPEGVCISGSKDGTFRFWQLPPAEPDAEPAEYMERVGAVAITPDGKVLATARGDEEVELWNVIPNQPEPKLAQRATFKGHSQTVLAVAITADAKTVASGSWDQTVKLWDVATRQERATLPGHTGAVRAVAFSADGLRLASGSADRSVRLWDPKSARPGLVLKGHTGTVRAVAFAPDGGTLASASDDGTVKLWSVATGSERATLRKHAGAVHAVAFANDGRTLVTGGADGTARLWDLSKLREREVLRWHDAAVLAAAITADGKIVATGGADNLIKLWPGEILRGHRAGVSSLAFTADGKLLAAASLDGQVQLWEVTRPRRDP